MKLTMFSWGNHNPEVVRVALSKRNLLALLSKLDHPDSQRKLTYTEEDGVTLEVVAESDEDHYGTRSYPPGPMIDYTEEDIVRMEKEGVQ